MQREIVLTEIAQIQLTNTIEYIETTFGERVKNKFISKLERVVNIIQENPNTFPVSKYERGVRKCVLNKQTTIYYKVEVYQITILTVFDNRQDISKLIKTIKNNKT